MCFVTLPGRGTTQNCNMAAGQLAEGVGSHNFRCSNVYSCGLSAQETLFCAVTRIRRTDTCRKVIARRLLH